jgi:hypothetical protein
MKRALRAPKIKEVSEGQIILLLQLCTERRKETEKTKEFRLPFQNNFVADEEERETDELDSKIHS